MKLKRKKTVRLVTLFIFAILASFSFVVPAVQAAQAAQNLNKVAPSGRIIEEASLRLGLLEAFDTVANFETAVQGSGFEKNESVTLQIKNPEGKVFDVHAQTDGFGKFSATIPETETQLAGMYQILIFDSPAVARPGRTGFEVFPGEMSSKTSELYTTKNTLAASGIDAAEITARITDAFGNPLEFHEVKLTSSRSADFIAVKNGETDRSGLAHFLVTSKTPGISFLTATDESASQIPDSRVKLVFAKTRNVEKFIGGDPETILLAQAGQTVNRFVIENVPATLRINEAADFTVRAVDTNGITVTSYTGTVLFSSTDTNADFPNSFTFQSSNQGTKTFPLALNFKSAGQQKLTVQEQGNSLLKGEKNIEVLTAGGNTGGAVRISKPATGTYSSNVQLVEGDAPPSSPVKIYDNGQLLAEKQATAAGRFSFTTPPLQDGQHTLEAESGSIRSQPVTITIDSTPSRVESFAITKTNLAPGETTAILIRSDSNLESVQVTVHETIIDLEADPQNPGVYRGILTAPLADAEYTVNAILTDSFGNVSEAAEIGKIRVDASLKPTDPVGFDVPSKVQGVQATPGNSRVILTWQPAVSASGMALYRIYYDTDPNDLLILQNTLAAETSWSIPNLQNGTTYYFQVVGVDAQGNESDNRSSTVSATPSATAEEDGPVLCDPMPCPPDLPRPDKTPNDGPEVGWMVVAAVVGGMWIKLRKQL